MTISIFFPHPDPRRGEMLVRGQAGQAGWLGAGWRKKRGRGAYILGGKILMQIPFGRRDRDGEREFVTAEENFYLQPMAIHARLTLYSISLIII